MEDWERECGTRRREKQRRRERERERGGFGVIWVVLDFVQEEWISGEVARAMGEEWREIENKR